MKRTNEDRPPCARSTRARALLILPLGLALSSVGQHPAQAETVTPAPSQIAALLSDWRSIGFAEPSKPAQMIVAGRHGYTTTGGQFNSMRQQIRVGSQDCDAGRDTEALAHINSVRAILGRIGRI